MWSGEGRAAFSCATPCKGEALPGHLLIANVEPGPDLVDVGVLRTALPEETLQLKGSGRTVVLPLHLHLPRQQLFGRQVGILEACLWFSRCHFGAKGFSLLSAAGHERESGLGLAEDRVRESALQKEVGIS